MLNGFSTDILKTQRGRFVKLEYAEVEGIEKFVRISKNGVVVTQPTFKNGYNWLNMPIHHQAINSYNIAMRETAQGVLYDIVLNGSTPSVSGPIQEEFSKMVPPNSFIIKITTPDGIKLLMSVLEFPAEISFNTSGGDAEINKSRITWQFKATLPFPIAQILN